MKTFLAIDIGASGGRHIVGMLKDGRLTATEVYRFENSVENVDGRLVWDCDRLFGEIVNGLKAAGEKGFKPDFVGIDTWAVDYVLLDKSDNPILPVYAYRDIRGEIAAKELHDKIPFERLYERSGIQYQPFNTVYQLYDDLKCGRLEYAETMLMLPDYFGFLLTGVKKREYTNATSTALVNAETHNWDKELLKETGLPEKLFGELFQPTQKVGKFKKEIADKVGYDACVVLPATHDTASAVVAAPLEGNCCYISSGTWSLLGTEQTAVHTDENSRKYNYSNEGGIDKTFRFQKNITGLWLIQRVRKELSDRYSFAELAELARKSRVDVAIDVNDPRFLAPKSMISEIESSVGRKLSVGELAYVIYNSLALCYKKSIEEMEEITKQNYDGIHIIGGGCNNTFLNELTSKACNKRVTAGPAESTAIGNLVIQMISAGELESLKEAREVVRTSFEVKEVLI